MKLAVINYPDTVGKTIVAIHLLESCIGNARIIAIEIINDAAANLDVIVEQMKGKRFKELLGALRYKFIYLNKLKKLLTDCSLMIFKDASCCCFIVFIVFIVLGAFFYKYIMRLRR